MSTQTEKTNKFTEQLMHTPISSNTDTSQGMMETLYQTMKNNLLMLEKFKEILKGSEEK